RRRAAFLLLPLGLAGVVAAWTLALAQQPPPPPRPAFRPPFVWPPPPPKTVEGKRGAVAADHPLASMAGLRILREGGNAVDAAAATAFVLGVVNPQASGIGGGSFLVLVRPNQPPLTYDFRETAPSSV